MEEFEHGACLGTYGVAIAWGHTGASGVGA